METIIDIEPLTGVTLALYRAGGERSWTGSVSRVIAGDLVILSEWRRVSPAIARSAAAEWDVIFAGGLANARSDRLRHYAIHAVARAHSAPHARVEVDGVALELLACERADWPTLTVLGYTPLAAHEQLSLAGVVPPGSAVLSRTLQQAEARQS